jgi:6,7-dimethyl-8-ribityllumazine synthase
LYDAIVCLGCIIKGETSHDQYLAEAVAHGLTRISIDHGMPVAFGVLTVDSVEQARERAGGKHGNKGAEAMTAAIEAAKACENLEQGKDYRLGSPAKDETRRKSKVPR